MFPLLNKIQKGYKFGQLTFYGVKHRGIDYQANYDSFYIPFPGIVEEYKEFGGGNWLRLKRSNGDQIELAHLKLYQTTPGYSRAGNLGGITGNSGAFTTNPHLHIQIKKNGVYIDPETYNWFPKAKFPIQLTCTLLINKMNWDATLLLKMAELQNWFYDKSGGKIQLIIDYKYVNISGWETKFYGAGPRVEAITEEWYTKNILSLAPKSDIVVIAISKNDWKGQVFDDPQAIEYGYCHSLSFSLKVMAFCDEYTINPFNPNVDAFVDVVRHEIGHGLYGLGCLYGIDKTHEHFFNHEFEKIFNDIDYDLLALNTNLIA